MRNLLIAVIAFLLDCISAPVVLLAQIPLAVIDLFSYSISEIRYALTGVRVRIEEGQPYIYAEYSYVGT